MLYKQLKLEKDKVYFFNTNSIDAVFLKFEKERNSKHTFKILMTFVRETAAHTWAWPLRTLALQARGLEGLGAFSVSPPTLRTSARQPKIQRLLGKPPTSALSQGHSALKPEDAWSSLLDRTDFKSWLFTAVSAHRNKPPSTGPMLLGFSSWAN